MRPPIYKRVKLILRNPVKHITYEKVGYWNGKEYRFDNNGRVKSRLLRWEELHE